MPTSIQYLLSLGIMKLSTPLTPPKLRGRVCSQQKMVCKGGLLGAELFNIAISQWLTSSESASLLWGSNRTQHILSSCLLMYHHTPVAGCHQEAPDSSCGSVCACSYLVCFTFAIIFVFLHRVPAVLASLFNAFGKLCHMHALSRSKSSPPMPTCLLLELRTCQWSTARSYFREFLRCFLLHWDQSKLSGAEPQFLLGKMLTF